MRLFNLQRSKYYDSVCCHFLIKHLNIVYQLKLFHIIALVHGIQ